MKPIKYITHNSKFHADENLGYTIAKEVFPEIQLHRTSKEKALSLQDIKRGDIISDTGGEYDPSIYRFDHHQGYFTRENGVPMSACGMLWKEYGVSICEKISGRIGSGLFNWKVAERVDEVLIQGICANDAARDYKITASTAGVEVRPTTLYHIIGGFNTDNPNDHEAQYEAFINAAYIAEIVLKNTIASAIKFVEGQDYLKGLFEKSEEVAILGKFYPWGEMIENYPQIKAVIQPGTQSPISIQLVSVDPADRSKGFRTGAGLKPVNNYKGFVHQSGFLAGAESIEQAIQLFKDNFNTVKS